MAEPTTAGAPAPDAADTADEARPALEAREPSRGGARSDVLVVLGTLVVLGLVGGVLWWLLVDPASYTRTRDGGIMDEEQFARQFDADAVFVVIAAVAGLVSGLALSWWRHRDPLLTSALLVVGAVLAAALMTLVGRVLGPGDPSQALRAAAVGAQVPLRLTVDAFPVYLVWPVAVLAGNLFVLLNRSEPATSEASRG